jgi:hypothetical protein
MQATLFKQISEIKLQESILDLITMFSNEMIN